jgi:hypothetical protein
MSTILYPPSRPQSVGEVLDASFRIFGATLLRCLPYSICGVIAGQLPTLYQVMSGRTLLEVALRSEQWRDPVWDALEIVALIGTTLLWNAVLLRQYALATGHPVASGAELATAARRIPGILLIAILLGLAVSACFIPASVALMLIFGMNAQTVLITLCIVLLPASWLLVRWSCAVSVYLLTERGPIKSMAHGWRLTGGSFWRLSLIYTVAIVLLLVLYMLSAALTGVFSLLFAHDVAVVTAVATAVVVLLGAIATPFYSALALAVLGDLSVRKEGTDLAQRIASPATR